VEEPVIGHGNDNTGHELTWRFHRNAKREWRWECLVPGSPTRRSTVFSRYQDCVTDARSAGYQPMLAAANLVPLSFVADPQPLPTVLTLNDDIDLLSDRAKRSSVLKKRVAHPAIERIFGKTRGPQTATNRTMGVSRVQKMADVPGRRQHSRIPAKSRLNRT
jgi:hypothetical protein